ncbi:MAG TPA: ROK family protein, partial [Mobilitalea sp.]|nr:ROK family protein [Mobilitalea sp.]
SMLREYIEISAKTVFDCAKKGDKLAQDIVEVACSYLGLAFSHIAQVIDPEVFVIGGGVSKAGDIITETVKKYYEMNVMEALKNKEIRLATLGNDAGIYGSAKLVMGIKMLADE